MGLHTWCYKHVPRTQEEAVKLAIDSIDYELDLFKTYKVDVKDQYTMELQLSIYKSIPKHQLLKSMLLDGRLNDTIQFDEYSEEEPLIDLVWEMYQPEDITYYNKITKRFYVEVDNFHDIFRTNKRNSDGTYTYDIILSKKECLKWIRENEVSNLNLPHLLTFWETYPDGLINFG